MASYIYPLETLTNIYTKDSQFFSVVDQIRAIFDEPLIYYHLDYEIATSRLHLFGGCCVVATYRHVLMPTGSYPRVLSNAVRSTHNLDSLAYWDI